jgi:hypothetical protein
MFADKSRLVPSWSRRMADKSSHRDICSHQQRCGVCKVLGNAADIVGYRDDSSSIRQQRPARQGVSNAVVPFCLLLFDRCSFTRGFLASLVQGSRWGFRIHHSPLHFWRGHGSGCPPAQHARRLLLRVLHCARPSAEQQAPAVPLHRCIASPPAPHSSRLHARRPVSDILSSRPHCALLRSSHRRPGEP